ncbi:ABC-2 transporter permease [Clostridium ganghwense]|uniref:ABC-2 transporter permease n=1 Tax=Clostridium ganghwense TaxID=312089 RepID=A0ABT4CP99_9CLOT|nr:ABC-2 transporter permease [Clostridium ganghwense]MCY6370885.1 ABC-2 transporter permease [Clostridium ganghwense]
MINLIKKDLTISFHKMTILAFIAYFLIMVTSQDYIPSDTVYLIMITTMAYFLSTISFTYDDRLKGEYILNSLPIDRKDIVISKYVSIFFYILIAILFNGILGGIFATTGIVGNLSFLNLSIIKKILVTTFLMCSLNFPLYFKYGYRRGKIFSIIIYFTFFAIANFLSAIGDINFLQKIIAFKQNNLLLVGSIVLLISICILITSAIVSLHIYENKDL